MLSLVGDLSTEAGAVIGGERVAENLHAAAVVEARDALHEVGGRVVAEVRGEVADAQAPTTGKEVVQILVGGLVPG